ncbi:MAG: hypothetical protein HYU04_00385 [Candidatus Wildermuthbacteria bacterium]|nr:hypothetical protein [Candidatus Wildermuthbacteria bacterium]
MRIAFIVLLLGGLVFIPQSAGAENRPLLPPSPPENPTTPENNAKAVKLEAPAGSLILQWKGVDTVKEYRYQYWKEGAPVPEPGQQEKTVTQPQSTPLATKGNSTVPADLEPGATYFWHVRSCADLNTNEIIDPADECGEYSDQWSFTFLLKPPDVVSPADSNIGLPVRFDWKEVTGSESYFIRGEIRFGEGLLGGILNNFIGGLPWFARLGVNFLLGKMGVGKEAITCPYALGYETEGEQGCISLPVNKGENQILPLSYADEECLFTKDTKYEWQIASCLGENGSFCGAYSDKTSFTTNDTYNGTPGFVIPAPILQAPFYDLENPAAIPPVVAPQNFLSWEGHKCSHIYKVIITRENDGKKIEAVEMGSIGLDSEAVQEIWNALDSVYTWQVKPCFMGDGQDITCEETVSRAWKFRTTGAFPTPQEPNDTTTVKIPVLLRWKQTDPATAYAYEISKNAATKTDGSFQNATKKGVATQEQAELFYEKNVMEPGAQYWWHVKTCVDEKGEKCGPWSSALQFSTFSLIAPSTPTPPNGEQLVLTDPVSWNKTDAANAYQYHLEYACRDAKETSSACKAYETTTKACPDETLHAVIEQEATVSSNSFTLPYCMGKYTWAVRSCLNNDCSGPAETRSGFSNNSIPWTLRAVQPPPTGVGLVPCGKLTNEPATPYDETDSCQPKHILLLLQNLLDFILWKISLFVLLVLAVMTGATSYFSLGGPNALARIKTVFKSFFVGFLLLMFAWMLVNIILMLLGFQPEFFGRWWEIQF